MVYISARLLLSALAISPALAAPHGLQQYEDTEARELLDMDTRSLAAKAFTTLATGVGIGGVLGGFFKKKSKRSTVDDYEDLSSRAEDDVEYLLVREADGSLNVYERSPLNAAGLLKIGSTIGKVASKLKKFVLPAVAVGGTALGTAAGRKANSRRSLIEDEDFILERNEDGELELRSISEWTTRDLDEHHFERELEELD